MNKWNKMRKNDTTYKYKNNEYGECVIGNENKSEFEPHIKFKKWGDECYFTLKKEVGGFSSNHNADRQIVENKYEKIRMYPIDKWSDVADGLSKYDESNQLDDGGIEFEVNLKKRPESNQIKFKLDSTNLEFHKQRGEGDDEKINTPEPNVPGSFAIYKKNNTNVYFNEKDADKYKTGKIGHIYRPFATDNDGSSVWCDLKIDGEYLCITIPKDFIDGAKYPIMVDPTIGYEQSGSNTAEIAERKDTYNILRCIPRYQYPAKNISGDFVPKKYTAYCSCATGSNINAKCTLYDGDKNLIDDLISSNTVIGSGEWYDFDIDTSNQYSDDFYFGIIGNANNLPYSTSSGVIYYDEDSSYHGEFYVTGTDYSFPDDCDGSGTSEEYKFSFYMTYATLAEVDTKSASW